MDFTNCELLLIAYLLDRGGDLMARQSCEDLPVEVSDMFSIAERNQMTKDYHDWNGDPEEWEDGHFINQDSVWAGYYAGKVKDHVLSDTGLSDYGLMSLIEEIGNTWGWYVVEDSVVRISKKDASSLDSVFVGHGSLSHAEATRIAIDYDLVQMG